MSTDPFDIPATALAWHRASKGAALAIVVQTWGSSPRAAGSMLVVSSDGQMQGSVSGGCVEGAVVVEAMDALQDGTPRLLEYGVSDDEAFAVGLACGGTIKVMVVPVGDVFSEPILAQLVEDRASQTPVALCVDTSNWQLTLERDIQGLHAARFLSDQSGFDGDVFTHIHNPPLRLAIIGGVHIAQNLVPMARLAGFDPIVIDPREAFANPERFPDTTILNDWPDEALQSLALDHRMAIVTLTHDPKLDDPALYVALASDVFYIGCLGSTRTNAKRLERLTEAGISAKVLPRINGPVGLNIGSKNPAEIAVSILAEIIQHLRQP